jgi:hypothetical protein
MTDLKKKYFLLDVLVDHSQSYIKCNVKSYVIKEIDGIVYNIKCDMTDLKNKWFLFDITVDRPFTNERKI